MFKQITALFVVLTLVTHLLADTETDKEELRKLYPKANALAKAGKYKEAIPHYEQALKLATRLYGEKATSTVTVLTELADAYTKSGQPEKAEPLLKRLGVKPTSTNPLAEARKLYAAGKYKEALPLFEKLAEQVRKEVGEEKEAFGTAMLWVAMCHKGVGDSINAEKHYKRALASYEAAMGKDHPYVAGALDHLGMFYRTTSRAALAVPLLERCLAIRDAKVGKEEMLTGNTAFQLALAYAATGKADKAKANIVRVIAITNAKQPNPAPMMYLMIADAQLAKAVEVSVQLLYAVLEIVEEKHGKNAEQCFYTLDSLGVYHQNTAKFETAEEFFKRMLTIAEANPTKEQQKTVYALDRLAALYQAQDTQRHRAEALLKRILTIQEKTYGKEHNVTSFSLGKLGIYYIVMKRYAEAEPIVKRMLASNEANKNQFGVANDLKTLARLYGLMGRHDDAKPLYKRSAEVYEAMMPKGDVRVADWLDGLFEQLRVMGRYRDAKAFVERSLEIREAKLGKDDLSLALVLVKLAGQYQAAGDYARWEELEKRALAIRETKLGKNHPLVANSLDSLAFGYSFRKRHDEAEPLLKRAIAIYEANLATNPFLIGSRNNAVKQLASLYQMTEQHAKVEAIYKKELDLAESKRKKGDPEPYRALADLAYYYDNRGEHKKAEPLLVRLLESQERLWGKDSFDIVYDLARLGRTRAKLGRYEEAAVLYDRERRITGQRASSTLASMTRQEQAQFFSTDHWMYRDNGVSLGVEQPDAKIAELSASWLLNDKGQALAALTLGNLLERVGKDSALAELASEVRSVRQEMARRSVAKPLPGSEKEWREEMERLRQKEEALGKELRRLGSVVSTPRLELETVRRALPKDGVLIDFVRYTHQPISRLPFGERYAVWVTTQDDVKIVDLGQATKVETAINELLTALKGGPTLIKSKGESQAEKALRVKLDALSALVLKPLMPHIGKKNQWLVSPDGLLWLVPFETLTLADGKYAIEKHTISYLTSGRDLVTSPSGKIKPTSPVILANPDFDLDPTKVKVTGAKDRSLSSALSLGAIQALPGTAVEAKAITPSLSKYAGEAPRLFTRDKAQEATFKSLRNPSVLVLATHGFFLADTTSTGWENPLLRCGLLLAGCNNAAKITSGDDGVLTGMEVINADLRGCSMVVLSACETGLGEVKNGEGVAGLRQAFLLSGAKSVVSTLWCVPDSESAALMKRYFAELSKGSDKAAALRTAKLALIAERRDDFAAAHPFFWAAFTLTGDSR